MSEIPQQDKLQHIWLRNLLEALDHSAQRRFLISTCNWLSKRISISDQSQTHPASANSEVIGGAAALLRFICFEQNSHLETELVAWLSRKPLGPLGLYRACVVCLSPAHTRQVMEAAWQLFSDKLSIEHTPILQQKGKTIVCLYEVSTDYLIALSQILLLTAGRMNRFDPSTVRLAARGPAHASGISVRLGSSSTTARFLGLVVGTAISRLVDKPEARMNFGVPEMESSEAEWYLGLTEVQDVIGSVQDLRQPTAEVQMAKNHLLSVVPASRTTKADKKPMGKIEIITSDEEEEDLIPYSKIDTDPEDEDDDPMTAKRDHQVAPV